MTTECFDPHLTPSVQRKSRRSKGTIMARIRKALASCLVSDARANQPLTRDHSHTEDTWSDGKYRYLASCVSLKGESISDMVDKGEEISRDEFCAIASSEDLANIERDLTYDRHFQMKDDWHVAYYKGYYEGKPCVYFTHSAIEYVFIKE